MLCYSKYKHSCDKNVQDIFKDSEHAEEKKEWPIHTSISHGFRLVSIMMSYLHAE